MQFDRELDVRGLNCPLPVLRAKKSLADMASGQVLKIVATDPAAELDFKVFSMQAGHQLLSSQTAGVEFVFFLKRR
ncbi:MAG TPA: sulfurtransferase TusA family protein [Burkholderiales bacterium]|nr:sulfurtransferase TusA family protein [Burkholderiales bacterium]